MVLVLGIIAGVARFDLFRGIYCKYGMFSMGAAKIEFVHVLWQTWLLVR